MVVEPETTWILGEPLDWGVAVTIANADADVDAVETFPNIPERQDGAHD